MTTEENKLIDAVRASNHGQLRSLLALGTNVNQNDDNGWTALSWAAAHGDIEIIRLLCESGADVVHKGKDQRTPYQIALAVSSASAARYLMMVEQKHSSNVATGRNHSSEQRSYCKAYPLRELQRFPGWQSQGALKSSVAAGLLSEDSLLFLHEDYRVSMSMWADGQVLFATESEEWRQFCHSVLNFNPPSDLDWLSEPAI